MKRVWTHAGLAAVLFVALAAYDRFSADEPFELIEFLFEDTPEWLLIAAVVSFSSYAVMRLRETLGERDGLAGALALATTEGNHWRETARAHSEGLGQAIRQQFALWRLSAGECDVAMLMLKGLSHKEIATLRNSSSATVRQQAAAIYQKSGLSSRAELAAYFLEDLFPSAAERGESPAPALSYKGHMEPAGQAAQQSTSPI